MYEEDDEAYDIWTKKVGIAPDHMVRLGKEDNFWEHGSGQMCIRDRCTSGSEGHR